MGGEARLFEAWCVPAWDASGRPDSAVRVLPPARTRSGDTPDAALAIPELGASRAGALVETLAGAREALLARSAADIAGAVGRVGARFLDDADPLRTEALALLPPTTGLSPAMCRTVLDGMARDWTGERLDRLLASELGDPAALDGFVVAGPEGTRRRAMGATFAFHLSAGSVPGVSATSLIRSLLVKSPVLVKPGRGDVVLPVLLLRGLAEEDADLARAAAVVYWPGGGKPEPLEPEPLESEPAAPEPLETAALDAAELVVVYGGDAVVEGVRRRLRPTTRLVAYHHRLSFAVVGRGAGADLAGAAERVARAVAVFDQRGCVSPHAIFVEGGSEDAEAFADRLAGAFDRLDGLLPPGRSDDAEASALQQLRGTAEMRAAAETGVSVRSGGASPWTVIVEPDGVLEPSCLGRTVRVLPVDDVVDVPGRVAGLGRHLQTVGHAGLDAERLEPLAEALARVGVLRIVPVEEVAFPPAWWRHDGRGPLEALVRWVELEGGSGGTPGPAS